MLVYLGDGSAQDKCTYCHTEIEVADLEWKLETGDCSPDSLLHPFLSSRLVGRVVKVSASRGTEPGFHFRFLRGDFSGSSHTSVLRIGTIESALGLVGPVSIFCDCFEEAN